MNESDAPSPEDPSRSAAVRQGQRLPCVCWPDTSVSDPHRVHEMLAAEPSTVRALRRRTRSWVQAVGLDEELAESIVLIVDEAVTNAVEHACPDTSCRVELVAGPRACGDGYAVLVADDGAWKDTTEPGFRGRGIQLMRQLARRSSIETDESGTTVRLCWPAAGLARPAPAR